MIAVPEIGIAPSRNALATKALVSSAFNLSSAMIVSNSSVFLRAMNFTHSLSTLALADTDSTNCSIRSFLSRSDGLESMARSISARTSLSFPVPFARRYVRPA